MQSMNPGEHTDRRLGWLWLVVSIATGVAVGLAFAIFSGLGKGMAAGVLAAALVGFVEALAAIAAASKKKGATS